MTQKKKKQNKSRKSGNTASVVVIAVLAIILVATAVMFVFSRGQGASDSSVPVDLYFYNNEKGEWEAEPRYFEADDEKQMLAAVINALYDGPSDSDLSPSIPADVQIDVKYSDNLKYVEIQFSDNYSDTSVVSASADVICRGSITMTLTGLSFVENVHFYVGDEELLTSSGQSIGDMNSGNTVVTPEVEPGNSINTRVTVYFPDLQGMGLVAEQREVTVTDSVIKEQCIVQALIAGPASSDLYGVFPSDTKLISVSVDSATSICYVNFSSDLLTKVSGSTGENMLLYSLVNSLTEDGSVKKVQLTFDGNRITNSSFNTDISVPLERDTSYIITE